VPDGFSSLVWSPIMNTETIFESSRLRLRLFDTSDSPFILELLNSPGWLQFIGDRNIRTLDDACTYLMDGPISSYTKHGFGLWIVLLKDKNIPIGMCGLLKRDSLSHPDIGFAFLPQYMGRGFATESIQATLKVAVDRFKLASLNAITTPDNVVSKKVLARAGFSLIGKTTNDKGEELCLFLKSLQMG
jgi:[ribosomal protein S5]-alanine N-acetyltransferase